MNIDDVFISIIDENLADELFRSTIDFNIELALFSLPHVLEDPNLENTIQKVKTVLNAQPIRKALHGPVVDLYYDSRDLKVRQVAWDRISQGLDICQQLGAEVMVAHSTFNPLFRASAKYPASWVTRSIEFWTDMAKVAAEKNVTVVFENIFDEDPVMIKEVIRGVDSKNFKACVDIGHVNIFSKIPEKEWVPILGDDLAYMHVHNNNGIIDQHAGIRKGTFDFKSFFNALKEYNVDPILTLELRKIEDIEPSKKALSELIG